jgi:ribonuclease BN (tRNA processing enzyme)
MRVTVIGCSGSFPGPHSPASCYLIEAEGFKVLLDLGNGALGALQSVDDMFDIDAVVLSHLHADHCIDMCGYWVARKFCPGGPKPVLPVHGPADTAMRLAQAYDMDPDPGMSDVFDFRDLCRGPYDIGPFRVTTALMNHPIEAYGFRFEHNGSVLAYSGDTGQSDALVELARDADLFLCEASFLDSPNLPTEMHLTGKEAGEHAARAGAAHLVLTHLIPWNDPALTLAEAKRSGYEGAIDVAVPGLTFEL